MSTQLAPKHQRLVLILIAVVALLAAALLAAWALRNQASFYYAPSDVVAHPPPPNRSGRLGGMVEKGSLKTEADGVTIDFVVTDDKAQVPVRYSGIVPDLFEEGSGVVAEGHLAANGTFIANNLLAKHDANYVPRELKNMTDAQKRAAIEGTTK